MKEILNWKDLSDPEKADVKGRLSQYDFFSS